MFGNIAPTPYDLNFSLLGVPIRVHPLFWLAALVLGLNLNPHQLPIWIAVVFVSIVVHEMGHALMIRSFGWQPSIVLYTFGGLAMHQPTHHSAGKQIRNFAGRPHGGIPARCGDRRGGEGNAPSLRLPVRHSNRGD